MTFKEDGYIIVKGFLTKEELDKLYKKCKDEPKDVLLNAQCPLSPSFYNAKYMEELLEKSLGRMQRNTGLGLFKTYAFWRWYMEGETLLPHCDRPACEISATIFVGGDPWEIHIRGYDDSSHVVQQELGDALIYRGCDLKHWREEFEGKEHAQVFIHYVDQDGPNKSHKGDTVDGPR